MSVSQKIGVVVQCGFRDFSKFRRISSAVIACESGKGTIFPSTPFSTSSRSSSLAALICWVVISTASRLGIWIVGSRNSGVSNGSIAIPSLLVGIHSIPAGTA